MNIILLTSQKKSIYLENLIKLVSKREEDKVFIYKKKINISYLKKKKINLMISFHYKHIINLKVLKVINFKAYNFHNSYLPENRGTYPVLFSACTNKFASCLHKINSKIDNGDIVFRKQLKFNENKTLNYVYHKLEKQSILCFKNIYDKLRYDALGIKKIKLIKQKKKYTYNNNFKSQILLANLPKKWLSKIKDVRKTYYKIQKNFT